MLYLYWGVDDSTPTQDAILIECTVYQGLRCISDCILMEDNNHQ